jgi:hypothetical protein
MQECTLKWTNEVFCPHDIQRERSKRDNVFVSNLLYMICSLWNKCVCALWIEAWVSYAQWCNSCTLVLLAYLPFSRSYHLLYVHLPGTFNTEHLLNPFTFSLMTNCFTARATELPSDLFEVFSTPFSYFTFHCVNLDIFMFTYDSAFSTHLRIFDWKRWRISMLEFEAVPQRWMSLRAGEFAHAFYNTSSLAFDSVDLQSSKRIFFHL